MLAKFGMPIVEISPASSAQDQASLDWIGSLKDLFGILGDMISPVNEEVTGGGFSIASDARRAYPAMDG